MTLKEPHLNIVEAIGYLLVGVGVIIGYAAFIQIQPFILGGFSLVIGILLATAVARNEIPRYTAKESVASTAAMILILLGSLSIAIESGYVLRILERPENQSNIIGTLYTFGSIVLLGLAITGVGGYIKEGR